MRLHRFLAILAIFALVVAACASDTADTEPAETEAPATEAPMEPMGNIGLVFDIGGRGDQSFNDSAARGLDSAKTELMVETSEASANDDGSNREELLNLQAEGNDLVFGIGFLFDVPMMAAATANPDVNFAIVDGFVDPAEYPNVASLLFAEEQGSFLVGAAAALKSESGVVGFIGGVSIDLIKKFEAGFIAGARAVNPDIEILSQYLTEPPNFDGFNDPAAGKVVGQSMYEQGADVVYHAAGGSGGGLFQAAKEYSDANGTHVWAIGVDSDQYLTASPDVQPFILTSMLKRVDVSVFNTIKSQVDGMFAGGPVTFDLSVDGVGYATSGGFVDDIADQLDAFKDQIISGEIVVPTTP
jgi:basic membrane protein A